MVMAMAMAIAVGLAHPFSWIWGGGFLDKWGTLDFAGGIVIHTTAGAGSVVCALMLGRRNEFERYTGEFPPHNLPLAAIGAALLWFGWNGFNGGSALQAGPVAVSAVMSTQVACCCAAFTCVLLSWRTGKPSLIALMNGALAGLAGITPASGYINTQVSHCACRVLSGPVPVRSVHL
jgi:ammonium transporter, Amt family